MPVVQPGGDCITDIVGVLVRVSCPTETDRDRPRQTDATLYNCSTAWTMFRKAVFTLLSVWRKNPVVSYSKRIEEVC